MPRHILALLIMIFAALPALALTPRETLAGAAFLARDKAAALAQIAQAESAAEFVLRRTPDNREALMIRAMALGYRAKLQRSRGDALAARRMFDTLAAANPRDPEAQAAVGAWHIDAVTELGGLVAGTMLGARKATGLAAMDRAIALGGDRAMFSGLAALLRLALDPKDARARSLAEAAARGTTPMALDRIMQRSAVAILVPLRAGDNRTAQALARKLLPFGRVPR